MEINYDKDLRPALGQIMKIKNGSILHIGESFKTILEVDQHFNWFQKLMWKWCFGVKVEDYSEAQIMYIEVENEDREFEVKEQLEKERKDIKSFDDLVAL